MNSTEFINSLLCCRTGATITVVICTWRTFDRTQWNCPPGKNWSALPLPTQVTKGKKKDIPSPSEDQESRVVLPSSVLARIHRNMQHNHLFCRHLLNRRKRSIARRSSYNLLPRLCLVLKERKSTKCMSFRISAYPYCSQCAATVNTAGGMHSRIFSRLASKMQVVIGLSMASGFPKANVGSRRR